MLNTFRAKYLTEPLAIDEEALLIIMLSDQVSSRTTIRTATTNAYREIHRLLRGYPTLDNKPI